MLGIIGASAPIFSTIIEKLGSLGIKIFRFGSSLPKSDPKLWVLEVAIGAASYLLPRRLSTLCLANALMIGQKVKIKPINEPKIKKLPIVRIKRIRLSIIWLVKSAKNLYFEPFDFAQDENNMLCI